MHFEKITVVAILIVFLVNCGLVKAKSNRKIGIAGYIPPVVATPKGTSHKIPLVEKYLNDGELDYGENILRRKLRYQRDDDQLRFGLGMLQFISGVENLMQDVYRYGLNDDFRKGIGPEINFIEKNPQPEALTYMKLRGSIKKFSTRLKEAESTLSSVSDPEVKLPLHFGNIKLDLNGDGFARDNETFWKIYSGLPDSESLQEQASNQFVITFDKGDVHWLRGYCHLLMAGCDILLAHDFSQTFDCSAHLVFANVKSPYRFLQLKKHAHNHPQDDINLLDYIAIIHTLSWDVKEPRRMKSALYHLESCVEQSHYMWSHIKAEKDDEREWIPNPHQTGVIPNVAVNEKMIDAWLNFLGDVEKVLKGEVLVTFWRGDEGYGVNVRRVFLEPRNLDLVLWVQGSSASPYLEKGKLTKMETWRKLDRAFGRQIPGFALWFN